VADSILDSVKKDLGLGSDYDVFDHDIITHINTALMTLQQLGVGPREGFMIEDAEPTWDAVLGTNPRLLPAKTYVYLKVRLVFDPPGTSFHLASIEKQITEIEWRLNLEAESATPDVTVYLPPPGPVIPVPVRVVDGGGAD
jgi:hypothetical protein